MVQIQIICVVYVHLMDLIVNLVCVLIFRFSFGLYRFLETNMEMYYIYMKGIAAYREDIRR